MDFNLNMDMDMIPIVSELTKQSALLWSLAEYLVPEEKWESFIKIYDKKKWISLLDFVEAFPNQFQNVEQLKADIQKQIDEMN